MVHHFTYKNIGIRGAEVCVDGKPIKCRRFSFENEVDAVPYAEVEIPATAELEGFGEIGLRMCVTDVWSAVNCLKMAYMLDDGLKTTIGEKLHGIIPDDKILEVTEALLGE